MTGIVYNIYIDGNRIGKSATYSEAIGYVKEEYDYLLPYLTWEPLGAGGVDCWSNGVNEIMIEKYYVNGIDLVELIEQHQKKVAEMSGEAEEDEDEEEKKRMPFTPKRTTLKMKKRKTVSIGKEGEVMEGEDGKKYIAKKLANGKMRWTRYNEKKYSGAPKKGTRKCPSTPAKEFKEGTVKKGLDGKKWMVKRIANGTVKWVRN